MEILYQDRDVILCIKPPRVLSTDEPGGLPELIRQALGDERANVRTVHRLDRVVSGVMVLARTKKSAAELSRQIREDIFEKEYLAVVHGCPQEKEGILQDLLVRDKARKMTMVVTEPGKDVQEARLHYQVLATAENLSKVHVKLLTGRTHQIRTQFSSRGMALVGDKKYGAGEDCEIALWSHSISFLHPYTGERMTFTREPPESYPWTLFNKVRKD